MVKRCGVEETRASKVSAKSADAVGRARKDWEQRNDAIVERLRGEFAVIGAKDRAAAVLEIGEATTEMLHKVDEAVREARKEEMDLTKAHLISVRYREVREVQGNSDAEVSRSLAEIEAKVRH